MKFNRSSPEDGFSIRLQETEKKRHWDITVASVPRHGEFIEFLTGDRLDTGELELFTLEVVRVVHILRDRQQGFWVYAKRTEERLTYA